MAQKVWSFSYLTDGCTGEGVRPVAVTAYGRTEKEARSRAKRSRKMNPAEMASLKVEAVYE